ncbi:hypothetical protein D3C76_829300 [compost metagenome]
MQSFGHVVESTPQLAQFVLAAGGAAGDPRRQLIGAPGIGLLAQLDQRHDQHAVQPDAQQQGEQPGDHTVGHELPEQAVATRHQALRQLNHQQPLLRVLDKGHAHPWQANYPATDRPIDAAQEGDLATLLRGQRRAAQRLQVWPQHIHPDAFLAGHVGHPGIDSGLPALLPGAFSLGGIVGQGDSGLIGEVGVLGFHVPTPAPAQADHQQTETDQQDRQLPEQRVTIGHLS